MDQPLRNQYVPLTHYVPPSLFSAWKGITAGVWLLSFAGFLIDWLVLYNNFGENPDEAR
jgi:hypothetical protein